VSVLWTRTVNSLALMVALLCAPAMAQFNTLPQNLVSKLGEFSAEEVSQLRTYAQPHLDALVSDDPFARARARANLVAPLQVPSVSVAFQQVYSTTLSPQLAQLVTDEDNAKVIAALEVAGWVATVESWQLIEPRLNDERPGIRLAACVASRTMLQAAGTRSPALNAQTASSIVTAISQRLADETDVQIADGLSRTLQQGGQLVIVRGFEEIGRSAWQQLANRLGDRMFATRNSMDHEGVQTRLTVLGALEQLRTTTARPVGTVDRAVVNAAASLGAETLAMVSAKAQASSGQPLSDEFVRMGRMTTVVLTLAATQASQSVPESSIASPPENPADYPIYFRDARTYVLGQTAKFGTNAERLRRWFE
jgi:hypothetical protein